MVQKTIHFHAGRHGSAIMVRIVSSNNGEKIIDILPDGTLEVGLKLSKNEAESNTRLIQFLSKVLRASRDNIEIVAGLTGSIKLVSILDLDPDTIQDRINQTQK